MSKLIVPSVGGVFEQDNDRAIGDLHSAVLLWGRQSIITNEADYFRGFRGDGDDCMNCYGTGVWVGTSGGRTLKAEPCDQCEGSGHEDLDWMDDFWDVYRNKMRSMVDWIVRRRQRKETLAERVNRIFSYE